MNGAHGIKYAKEYLRLHKKHQKWFSGQIDIENADAIAELVSLTGAKRLLDFGSGKGYQYLVDRVHERWGGILPYCYDPGVWQLRMRPDGLFDGVICTDVLEHIAEPDIPGVLQEIRDNIAPGGFAYLNVFCNLAGKTFTDGRNVHLTVKPPSWWDAIIHAAFEGELVRVDYEYYCGDDLQQKRLGNLR